MTQERAVKHQFAQEKDKSSPWTANVFSVNSLRHLMHKGTNVFHRIVDQGTLSHLKAAVTAVMIIQLSHQIRGAATCRTVDPGRGFYKTAAAKHAIPIRRLRIRRHVSNQLANLIKG